MKFPDVLGIIVCWMIRKRMKWFPRWEEYFALSDQAYRKYAEFSEAYKDHAARASTRSRGYFTSEQTAHIAGLFGEALDLWKAADRLMRAPYMHHITSGEEPA